MRKLMKEEYEDGFLEIDLDSIDDYMSLISGNKNFEGWLFRGQGDSNWGLNSSYNRECINAREANIYYERKEHLERFRKSIRGRLPISNTDAISDIELWAIGQHYGLKTPLLDWTASPYVALFFAFYYANSSGKNVSIWLLNARLINWLRNELVYRRAGSELPSVLRELIEEEARVTDHADANQEVFDRINDIAQGILPRNEQLTRKCQLLVKLVDESIPLIISPSSSENSRLVNQRGMFTYSRSDKELKRLITEMCQQKSFPLYGQAILTKVNIGTELREECMAMLDAMNINFLSLFPDLFGSSMHCNEKIRFGV
ncbi:FRG domain-containing protein [Vibrio parahaemolyticus]|nr:FRG domain-containing protein [Vibrio parahaemolyticus]TOF53818.1 hypothetical protein CGJ20_24620 [Vibrio parahaemolyticus]